MRSLSPGGLLLDLLCRWLLRLSEVETRAVAEAWPLLVQAPISDNVRRRNKRLIDATYVEAHRIVSGGDFDEDHPQAEAVLNMLLASGASIRHANGDIVMYATEPEALLRLRRQYNLEITKSSLGVRHPLPSPEVEKKFEEEGSGRGDLLAYTGNEEEDA